MLTLGSTSEVSLASRKILSNRSSPDFRNLPARDEGARTKPSSSVLGMRGIMVTPLLGALTSVHVGLVEVPGWSLVVIGSRFGCGCRWVDEEELGSI